MRSALAADALFLMYLFLIYLCDGFLHEMEGSSLEPYNSYSYICAIGSCWRWSALIPAHDKDQEHVCVERTSALSVFAWGIITCLFVWGGHQCFLLLCGESGITCLIVRSGHQFLFCVENRALLSYLCGADSNAFCFVWRLQHCLFICVERAAVLSVLCGVSSITLFCVCAAGNSSSILQSGSSRLCFPCSILYLHTKFADRRWLSIGPSSTKVGNGSESVVFLIHFFVLLFFVRVAVGFVKPPCMG